jgi:hypothetical protein
LASRRSSAADDFGCIEVGQYRVEMSLHIPLNELELAFGLGVLNVPNRR